MYGEMKQAAESLEFEKAARLRDEIHMLETLDKRGELETHVQPEVFFIDPKKGLAGLRKVLKLSTIPRTIEGVDIAHLGGDQTVASLVQFIDGLPFKPGYRRFKIRGVSGIDDFRSIHEVVARRFQRLHDQGEVFPDLLLIDGGKGQLNAALAAFAERRIAPPVVLSLAKRDEEIFLPGRSEPLAAESSRLRPAIAAVCARRGASLRSALPPHPAAQEDAGRITEAAACRNAVFEHSLLTVTLRPFTPPSRSWPDCAACRRRSRAARRCDRPAAAAG